MLGVQHAFLCNFFTLSAKQRRQNFRFEILTTTRACSRKSFVLSLCMKAAFVPKQAKVRLAYFVQLDQLGIIAKHLT